MGKVLAFALLVYVDDVQQNDIAYFADIFRCNQFAAWTEFGSTHAKDKRQKKKQSQVNVTAFCKPVFVSPNLQLLD